MTLAVLASGRGSNLASLMKAFPGEVSLVVSNRADAPALDRARAAGVTALHVPFARGGGAAFEARLDEELLARGVTLVLLAGFMRLLSPEFTSRWRGRVLNIHPSLLPDFPGLHAHEQALAAGVPFTGCTVHFVDAGMDTGEVIVQKRVPVEPGDTPDSLAARLLPAEHEAYPQAVRLVRRGLAFPTPTPPEIAEEFNVTRPLTPQEVRVARLLRGWGRADALNALWRGAPDEVVALAGATDDLRLAWTSLDPRAERVARWEGRAPLLNRAESLGLRAEVESALAVTADEWPNLTY